MISKEERDLRMRALLSLKDKSIIKIDDSRASKTINSRWELKIDVTFPVAFWEVKGEGKHFGLKDVGVPAEVKKIVETLVEKYNLALETLRNESVSEAVEVPELEEEEKPGEVIEKPEEEKIETPEAPESIPEVPHVTEPQEKEKKLISLLHKLLAVPTKEDNIFSTGGANVASVV